jgi:hypothetical protein
MLKNRKYTFVNYKKSQGLGRSERGTSVVLLGKLSHGGALVT